MRLDKEPREVVGGLAILRRQRGSDIKSTWKRGARQEGLREMTHSNDVLTVAMISRLIDIT